MTTARKLLALAAALLALPAAAQERAATAASRGKVGIGVGLSTAGNLNTSQYVLVPINATPSLRVEPLAGWSRSDVDSEVRGFAPAAGKTSDFALGAGVFWVSAIAPQAQLYLGGRLLLQWQSFREAGPAPDRWERRNTILAPALGAEWAPHARVAFGAEAMLGLVRYGDTEFTNGANGVRTTADGGSGSFTQGTVFVRFYLL